MKIDEAIGMRLLERPDRLAQALARAPGQVHHDPDVAPIHGGQHILRRRRNIDRLALRDAAGRFCAERDVRVDVDDRKTRARGTGVSLTCSMLRGSNSVRSSEPLPAGGAAS